ncbi:UNVERIFIED_ORG: ABC-type glycerol-3-phosphate transport system substrate-binding protein [Rhizobium sp. SORGH_AS260]|nr:ABC-type glycerol-3-phosphate transport system substrate-binding protein [Rhizobium sp. SORGH_AS_0260]
MRKMKLRAASAMAAGAMIIGASALAATAEEPFDLDAVLAAAKQEKPINIYDSTGKIVEMADKFSAKYGLKATGVKVSANSQLEMIIRESQSNNVQGDVVLITDAPSALAQLLPAGFCGKLPAGRHELENSGAVSKPTGHFHQRQRLGV